MKRPTGLTRFAAVAVFLSVLFPAWATPPNRARLDGQINEYDAADLRGTNPNGVGNFGGNNQLTNLFVTWDADYLYLALQGNVSAPVNKLVILLDVDPGNGTGASTTTNWADSSVTADAFRFNEVGWSRATNAGAVEFGLDYMFSAVEVFNNALRILYDGEALPDGTNVIVLLDAPNGATPTGGQTDMASGFGGAENPLWGMEARISWTQLYGTNARFGVVNPGKKVPAGATLRLFANIHNNNPNAAYSASNAIPLQTSPLASYVNGHLVTDSYIDVVVDGDNDGLPDLGAGDLNAPFIKLSAGVAGQRTVFAWFNEAVTQASAENALHWRVGNDSPDAVERVDDNAALLRLPNDLPAAGTFVLVTASNVQDGVGNTRRVESALFPSSGGLTTSITVRFVLDTDSGMGLNPTKGSNFFVNGSSPPLEFGFPPERSSPLALLSGTNLYYRDVTFPAGTPNPIFYKYSAELVSTGTNNYEAVRLDQYDSRARVLTLDTNGLSMVVTDYLGAAAAPLRPVDTNGYKALYFDARRGDAGVRARRTVLFQLDLSLRDTNAFDRVLIQGTDPLRGFNVRGDNNDADFAGAPTVNWLLKGITLVDDGTLGDAVAGDGIYSRLWSLTADGLDNAVEPGTPFALVGGSFDTTPYFGNDWENRRSPRSFKYKYYVVKDPGGTPSPIESPPFDIEVYLEGSDTNVIFPPFVWANNSVPTKPPSNAAEIVRLTVTNGTNFLVFVNEPSEAAHNIEVAYDILGAWNNYDLQAAGAGGFWTARLAQVSSNREFFRVQTGPGNPAGRISWSPGFMPPEGGVLTVDFVQNKTDLAGERDIRWFGRILGGGFTNLIPMTFLGNGHWTVDIPVPPATNQTVQFLFSNPLINKFGKLYGDDIALEANGRVTWTPAVVPPGGAVTITYNPQLALAGKTLPGATNILLWYGFDNFQGFSTQIMTRVDSTQWMAAVNLPAQFSNTLDFVFRDATNVNDGTAFDNIVTGLNWRILIQP
jgi:hypothetical protein